MFFEITTYQDSLGHWHAVLSDNSGNTVAGVPQQGDYGFDSESQARKAVEKVDKRYERSYESTEN